jgi:SOS-response transcriptional repressor LexA
LQKLDYIFTVDIFNEGVDIPKVNQILMIRPTESAIIFIQQLGRGLRKAEGKGYLTVIDFIGNYKNNYLIPIALYGDTSYNKDTLRRIISQGSRTIPGASTINFDEITKERIFKSIDSANLRQLADLKKDYKLLKYKLGRIPFMIDFIEHGERDPFSFVEYSKSYYNFINKIESDFDFTLNKKSRTFLEYFSKEINNSKRVEESIILKHLIIYGSIEISKLKHLISTSYDYIPTEETIQSCIENLNFSFIQKDSKNVYRTGDLIQCDVDLREILSSTSFKNFLMDSVEYSIKNFTNLYDKNNYNDGLIRYNKYSRKDVCRLINWPKDLSSTVYGYRTNNEITPCFVTYHKSSDIDNDIKYNDHFITSSLFAWESRSNRKLESPEIQKVIASKRILLFVKKEDGEGTDFYYLGDASIVKDSVKQDKMEDSGSPVVHFTFEIDQPVIETLYSYLTKNNTLENNKIPQKDVITLINNKPTDTKAKKYKIPFYNFYAAAGSFSEMQSEKDFNLITVPEKYKSNDDYFACKIKGESMNKIIPNNSICIFKKYIGGSRNGKIVLVENKDFLDPDFNSSFTVKTYSSEKIVTDEGWQHSSIVLRPNSYDKKYKNIIIDENNGSNMNVVGEFVTVL